ncbi:unnamed protein product [Withania somnifera]
MTMWSITTLAITVFLLPLLYAYDNVPLQDICVADNSQALIFVNGKTCKNPKLAKPDDFFTSGLNVPGNIVPGFDFPTKLVDVTVIPGLNTQAMTIARADLGPKQLFPLHTHPRAAELVIVLDGRLYVGFLVPNPENVSKSRLFAKILNPGDVFVFPKGLIHFQYNVANKTTSYFGFLNSQNPGIIPVPSSILVSDPPIMNEVLSEGFKLNKIRQRLQN